jgi:ribonuclease-3
MPDKNPDIIIEALIQTIGYRFKSLSMLEEALRHSSFVNEQALPLSSNERLEFLGDTVLNLVVSHLLMDQFPDMDEGSLSMVRAGLVNETCLAAIATGLDLGECVQLGKGEIRTRGRYKKSILADTYEALLAAVYLDGGFDSAFALIQAHFAELIKSSVGSEAVADYKTRVQEVVQKAGHPPPDYRVTAETGPDHDKTFCVSLQSADYTTEGTGKSKKAAEQDAARKAFKHLARETGE